ncbi:MAG: NAD+ synthase [Anaerolineae bacterium]|nr:NAD+ synthase [Anaerolineae bacterium]
MALDVNLVRAALTRFIREQIAEAGRRRAVLGLSGGLDSAVVCYLAAEALGPDQVLALTMPYATSAPESLADALSVVSATGVRHEHFEVTPLVQPLIDRYPTMDRRRRGNAMARARMTVLYDQSEAFGGLVVGTSNKTETLLGYSTVHGDSACALAPIADLYKTQVRQLARRLGVPAAIIDKAPSADLWPGQTDEADLGLSYDEADAILLLLLEERQSPAEVIARGFAEAKVQRVCDLCRRSYFKRRLPPVAAVSTCCVGRDIAPGTVPPHMDDQ